MGVNTPWPPEREARLVELLGREPALTLGQIALRMGLTKNTVIGKVTRMRRSGHFEYTRMRRSGPCKVRRVKRRDPFTPRERREIDALPDPPQREMFDFPPPGHCQWPEGEDPCLPGFGFCGAPALVGIRSPYCGAHARRAGLTVTGA